MRAATNVAKRLCSSSTPTFPPANPSTEVSLDVVGEYSLQGSRMSAGAMLGLMDICAVRGAHRLARKMVVPLDATYSTVGVDDCNFLAPAIHGDLVKVESTPVLAGKSSITVNVSCFRRSLRSREWQPIQHATFAIVVIDKNTLKKVAGVPQILYEHPTDERLTQLWTGMRDQALLRRKVVQQWAQNAAAITDLDESGRHLLVKPPQRGQTAALSPEDTRITLRRMFLPRSQNYNNTIFGGDLLEWMESGAMYCAMNFAGHRDIVTISMNRVSFGEPLTVKDWVSLEAVVVFVSKHTIHVEVTVTREKEQDEIGGGGEQVTHTASFVCMGMSLQTGRKEPIMTSLEIPQDDLTGLQKHHSALQRYKYWKRHQHVKHEQVTTRL